jgi:TPR repeat protein
LIGEIRAGIWFKKAAEMNDGAACIELAKIYKARKGRQKTAADLLRLALRMSKDHISEDARREAESLIKETANSRNNNDLHQVVPLPLPPKQD